MHTVAMINSYQSPGALSNSSEQRQRRHQSSCSPYQWLSPWKTGATHRMFWPEIDASAQKLVKTGELSTSTWWTNWKTSPKICFVKYSMQSCKLSSVPELSTVLFLAYAVLCSFNRVILIKVQGLVSVLFCARAGVRNQRDVLTQKLSLNQQSCNSIHGAKSCSVRNVRAWLV